MLAVILGLFCFGCLPSHSRMHIDEGVSKLLLRRISEEREKVAALSIQEGVYCSSIARNLQSRGTWFEYPS
jgi:hypothetical protein